MLTHSIGLGDSSKFILETIADIEKRLAAITPKAAKAAPRAAENCIPTSQVRHCTSRCVNGSCTVTYSNGCKVKVPVAPKFNPFNSQWDYPSPSC